MFTPEQIETAKHNLRLALERRDMQRADVICRYMVERFCSDPAFQIGLGNIALLLDRPAAAERHFSEALSLSPVNAVAGQGLRIAAERRERTRVFNGADRYLLITAWGFGFWSDVNHVLGSLLLAEMTGRVPVIHWGDNSLFSPKAGINAWELYFAPSSSFQLSDLVRPGLSHFPHRWDVAAIAAGHHRANRTTRPQDTCGLSLLARDESVVISDAYVGVPNLLPWLDDSSSYFGCARASILRDLAKRFLVLQPHLDQRISSFWNDNMRGHHWVAVHVRGSDKQAEISNLDAVNRQYFAHIDALLNDKSDTSVFLLTDSLPILGEFEARYPGRVRATDSIRVSGSKGVHHSGHDPVAVAEEVIVDTWLASRCDSFLGNGSSNVSLAVEYLKEWPEGSYQLLGADLRERRSVV